MTLPPMLKQQKWRLSIVLAILLVRSHFCSTDVNTTESTDQLNYKQQLTTTAQGEGEEVQTSVADEKYDVIDVAAANRNDGGNVQTGQTTRFFVTGDVDDDFWLKHLGEDFRHAIHLQVGGSSNDHYDDVYNTTMTEDGSTYEIHQRYKPKVTNENPVKGNKTTDSYDTNDRQDTTDHKYSAEKILTIKDGVQMHDNTTQHQLHAPKQDEMMFQQQQHQQHQQNKQTNEATQPTIKNDTLVETPRYEAPYEQVFAIDDDSGHNLANQFYNPSSFNIPPPSSNNKESHTKSKYPKYITQTQHDTYKEATKHKHKHTHTKHTQDGDDSISKAKSHSPTVVVTLPQSQKTVHQMDVHEKPVVVKMPPVIYHSNPQAYSHNSNTNTNSNINTNTDTTQTQHNTHTEQQYQQQQQQQQQQNPPHYTQYHQHSNTQQQQQPSYTQHPQNFYNPPPFSEGGPSSSYTAQDVYRSLDRKNESTNSGKQKQTLHYILRRPPVQYPLSSYGSPPPYSSNSPSRVSRSTTHHLFNRKL